MPRSWRAAHRQRPRRFRHAAQGRPARGTGRPGARGRPQTARPRKLIGIVA
jgi:hypothetical protein